MLFDIFFDGKMVEGSDESRVRENLATLFKVPEQEVVKLLSGGPVRIKSGVDEETAVRYRTAFLKAGALVDIRPAGDTAPDAVIAHSSKSGIGTGEDLSLLPPNTGSLADCAPEVVPAEIGDISGIQLAPPGATLDGSPPPASPEIATEGLSLTPAGVGSLEDCQLKTPDAPLPDISGMALEEDERDL